MLRLAWLFLASPLLRLVPLSYAFALPRFTMQRLCQSLPIIAVPLLYHAKLCNAIALLCHASPPLF